jgi:hypothetical protein
MREPLYLFCGGAAHDNEGRPKPLIQVCEGRSLLKHFLRHKEKCSLQPPKSITLLCENGQETIISREIEGFDFPVPIDVEPCGYNSSTFEKFCRALKIAPDPLAVVQFGYPDIFTFGECSEPIFTEVKGNDIVFVSAASISSRFPRLILDIYKNKVRGISNYASPVPANPLFVFGGDIWGRVDILRSLVERFLLVSEAPAPSLEYDFFFWLINQNKMSCIILNDERLWVDSQRDLQQLVAKTQDIL